MRRPRLLLLALAALLALPSAAHAARGQTVSFEAPRDLLDPALRPAALEEIGRLGARSLRVVLYWRDVAPAPTAERRPDVDPTDPAAYDWSRYDPVLDAAAQRGWRVTLTVSGPVPRWATLSRRDQVTRPSPKQFGEFMQAAGRHYAGRVAAWSIWNEPNHPQFLMPQYFRGRPASPRWYRRLFSAAVNGLGRAGQGAVPVLMGETAPVGTRRVVAPLTFLRGALCLSNGYRRDRTCSRLPADGYAHHAYAPRAGPFFVPPSRNDVTIGVLRRLVTALDRAGRTGAIRARMPIHLTEFGIQSVPDELYGVSELRQAEFQAIAERLAAAQPRVRAFSQYLLRDDPAVRGRHPGFESGLRFANGRAKLSLRSWPVPLAALRRGSRVSLWGLARPAHGRATVEVLVGSRTYLRARTDVHGVFTRTVPHVAGRRYRLRWAAPDGRSFTGPAMRVYSRP